MTTKLTRRRGRLPAVLVGLALVAAACGDDDSSTNETSAGTVGDTSATTVEDAPGTTTETGDTTATDGEPVIIGQAVALSGIYEPFDGPPAVGTELAIEDINAAGGVLGRSLATIQSDNQSTIEGSATAGQEVVDGGAEVVIVQCDYDFGSPAARVAEDNGLVAFSTCAGSPLFGVDGIGQLAFTLGSVTPTEGAVGAEFATEQGWSNAFIFTDTLIDYSTSQCEFFEEAWTELGGSIAGQDTFSNADESVATQLSRLQSIDPAPDFIYLCTFPPGGASVVRQIRAAGIDIPILSGFGMDGTYWLDAVPDLSDFYNTSYASLAGDDPEPRVNEFFDRFEERTGDRPATSAALTGYAVVEAIALAAEQAGTFDGEELAAALETFDDVDLIVGPTSFDEQFHFGLERPMRVVQIQGGELSFAELITPSSVPTP